MSDFIRPVDVIAAHESYDFAGGASCLCGADFCQPPAGRR